MPRRPNIKQSDSGRNDPAEATLILVFVYGVWILSSPEPLGSRGELIVYPSSRRPSVCPSSVGVRRSQCSKIFSKTTGPIKAKFYVEPPWVGGTIFCSRHLGHMTKMAATPIYGKKPFKNLHLQNRRADFHETWYVASGTPAHRILFK